MAREEWNDWVDHYGVDALGSVRWVYGTNNAWPNYTVNWDVSDYYPFGAERVLQSNSNNDRKFTGKERDTESGNDNFAARFYSSQFGRFMSIDPVNAGAEAGNPQSRNVYSYVSNNPANFTDPFGLFLNVPPSTPVLPVVINQKSGTDGMFSIICRRTPANHSVHSL